MEHTKDILLQARHTGKNIQLLHVAAVRKNCNRTTNHTWIIRTHAHQSSSTSIHISRSNDNETWKVTNNVWGKVLERKNVGWFQFIEHCPWSGPIVGINTQVLMQQQIWKRVVSLCLQKAWFSRCPWSGNIGLGLAVQIPADGIDHGSCRDIGPYIVWWWLRFILLTIETRIPPSILFSNNLTSLNLRFLCTHLLMVDTGNSFGILQVLTIPASQVVVNKRKLDLDPGSPEWNLRL